MKNKSIIVLSLLFLICSLFSNTNFRVISYNTLNFDGTDRLTDFETVLTALSPDVLICQEIESASASDAILTILNSAFGGFARASFVNDGDLNNMLYYKTSIGTLVSQDVIDTSPRDISEYVMSIDDNPIRFYSCHLKASDGSSYEAERLAAVTSLRYHLNALSEGTEFIIAGDMNFYTSSEDGYQKFIASETNNIGRAEDLCSQVGSWNTNPTYANVHTQSTRTTSFGGGAIGGLDDKFDFIFGNYGINNGSGIEYSSNSFTPYGNDGNHFDQSINNGTNSAVPANVADALYYASDHLPVYADFVSLSGTSPSGSLIISEYIEGSSYNKAIEIYNGTGAAVDLSAYSLEKDVNGDEEWAFTYNFSGTLAHKDVFVLANSSADPAILGVADATDNGVINFNGDDQVRLLKYGVEIDRIGIPGDVSFGENVTYVRKPTVTSPQSGPQDPRSNGEWDGYPIDTFSYLGSHSAINPIITVTSPNGSESWERGNPYNITWTSADFTGNVRIELYKEAVRDYTELIASTENDSIWQWNIPLEQSIASDYKIKISDAVDGNPYDESNDFFSITGIQSVTELFISEYIEGSSNNKAIEIFNGTTSTIDLTDYSVKLGSNGGNWGTTEILTGNLTSNDVYVIYNSSADAAITNVGDISSTVTYFNGNDALGLFHSDMLIDVIGEQGFDPVTAWDVAGTTGATGEHTLVRKSTVTSGNTDWTSSAGTTPENSEWIVYSQDTFDYLGAHTMGGNVLPFITNIVRNPAGDILSTTTVSISANVTDSDGTLTLVKLHWGLASGSLTNTINMTNAISDVYTTDSDIPAQTNGATIYYVVYAEDNVPESSTSTIQSYVVWPANTNLTYTEPFDDDLGLCYTYSDSGATKEWYWHYDSLAAMNGYNSGDTEVDWLILPGIDFDSYSGEEMTFDSWYNFGIDNATNYLKLYYSADYPGLGDPSGYTWDELTFTQPTGSSTWTPSGSIDLSAITGTSVYIAFKYRYEVGNYRWWKIDNLSIGEPMPPAPTDLTITISGAGIDLIWTAVAGATGYNVFRSTDPYSFGATAYGTSPTNSYTDVGGAIDVKYFYKVTATN
ncbi:MAG: lamin tail domain-containing protein [Candidatus Tenebribacter burtonii]|nr:lamin tail domain-containing protein [Candidatus Tenebribacter burtonii]